jgi:hypothetical protein
MKTDQELREDYTRKILWKREYNKRNKEKIKIYNKEYRAKKKLEKDGK